MSERVFFPSTRGPDLAGLLDLPEGSPRGWGVFAHGFALSKDSPAAARICKQLATEGIGMLRFDNLGLGHSSGEWGDGSFTVKVADTVRAAEYMRDHSMPVDILVGHSLGGAAVLAAARSVPSLRCVVTVGAPVHPSHVQRHYEALLDRVMADGHAEWLVGGKRLRLTRTLVEDVGRAELHEHIRLLRLPLLVMHSPTDTTVGIENAGEIFGTARHPRSFVSLEGSDHLLSAPGQARRAARIMSAWADQYLQERGHRSLPRDARVGEGRAGAASRPGRSCRSGSVKDSSPTSCQTSKWERGVLEP